MIIPSGSCSELGGVFQKVRSSEGRIWPIRVCVRSLKQLNISGRGVELAAEEDLGIRICFDRLLGYKCDDLL